MFSFSRTNDASHPVDQPTVNQNNTGYRPQASEAVGLNGLNQDLAFTVFEFAGANAVAHVRGVSKQMSKQISKLTNFQIDKLNKAKDTTNVIIAKDLSITGAGNTLGGRMVFAHLPKTRHRQLAAAGNPNTSPLVLEHLSRMLTPEQFAIEQNHDRVNNEAMMQNNASLNNQTTSTFERLNQIQNSLELLLNQTKVSNVLRELASNPNLPQEAQTRLASADALPIMNILARNEGISTLTQTLLAEKVTNIESLYDLLSEPNLPLTMRAAICRHYELPAWANRAETFDVDGRYDQFDQLIRFKQLQNN